MPYFSLFFFSFRPPFPVPKGKFVTRPRVFFCRLHTLYPDGSVGVGRKKPFCPPPTAAHFLPARVLRSTAVSIIRKKRTPVQGRFPNPPLRFHSFFSVVFPPSRFMGSLPRCCRPIQLPTPGQGGPSLAFFFLSGGIVRVRRTRALRTSPFPPCFR